MKIRFILIIILAVIPTLGIIVGKCPKCGTHRIGFALLNPRHQTCPNCGAGLEIANGARKVSKGYSPFTAERYLISPPRNVPSADDKEQNSHLGKK